MCGRDVFGPLMRRKICYWGGVCRLWGVKRMMAPIGCWGAKRRMRCLSLSSLLLINLMSGDGLCACSQYGLVALPLSPAFPRAYI